MRLELRENEADRNRKEQRKRDYQRNGNRGKDHVLVVTDDKERMAYHKGNAACGKPLRALGNEQHVSQPAEEQRKNYCPIRCLCRKVIETQKR